MTQSLNTTFVYNCSMAIAVCDSSSLILLAKVGLLGHLSIYADKVLIPTAVFNEAVVAGKQGGKEDAFIIEREIEKNVIDVSKVKDNKLVERLLENFRIELGEAEAIALSIEKNALFLTIDDREGIKACRVFGVPFVTALAFLVKLTKDKKIPGEEASLALDKLQRICLYSDDMLSAAKKECGLNGNSD